MSQMAVATVKINGGGDGGGRSDVKARDDLIWRRICHQQIPTVRPDVIVRELMSERVTFWKTIW